MDDGLTGCGFCIGARPAVEGWEEEEVVEDGPNNSSCICRSAVWAEGMFKCDSPVALWLTLKGSYSLLWSYAPSRLSLCFCA